MSYPNPKARPEQDTQYIPLTQQNHSNVCTGTLLCTNTAVTGGAGWQPFEQLLTQRSTQKAQEKSNFSHIVIPSIKCLPSQVTQQLKLSLARLPTQFTPAQNIRHWTRCHPAVHSQLRGFGAVLLVLALKVFEGSFIPLIFVLTPKTTDPLYT